MIELTEAEFAEAEQRGAALLAGPRAETVHFDRGRNRIIVRLTTGVEIGFSPRDAQGLQNASLTDLRQVEVDAMGLAIRFPALDADF